ncbi:dehydrodolichyl diphosphate synthase complex subunit DHDDS-like [Phlebotomus argentipes]|uniref:dehydrodolichyl diphosphate synthase complex subunit DHDDS-like n=1 Tax=Phlebotomus argentipes TaxID=94469 RepID=UPI00289298A9|nr:dehydrodolichyl diphosphate synthase complex subunit DHDDS-like [Phlebotomus argentipes]
MSENNNRDHQLSWWEKVLLRILSYGPEIRHLAVVMDGNRRYAKRQNMSTQLGHRKGGRNFGRILKMVQSVGIQEVTVYAFSVENFNRNPAEVRAIQQTLEYFANEVLDGRENILKGIKVRFIGEVHMLSEECQKCFQKLMKATEENSDFLCNIAVAYASRVEITRAIKNAVQNPKTLSEDVDHEVLEEFLYIPKGRPVDLWLRTSGETRFSDFLTWQSDKAVMHFSPVLWPEFGAWDLLKGILQYSRSH